jgi:hypothetical protein
VNTRYLVWVCMMLVPALAGAEIHQCAGEDGVVQYRDRPCDDTSSSFKPLSKPAGGASPGQRLDKTRKLLRAYEDERRQQRDQRAREKEEKAERRRSCNHARDQLRNITSAGNLYRIDDDGKRTLLSDQQRELATERARQEIADRCD